MITQHLEHLPFLSKEMKEKIMYCYAHSDEHDQQDLDTLIDQMEQQYAAYQKQEAEYAQEEKRLIHEATPHIETIKTLLRGVHNLRNEQKTQVEQKDLPLQNLLQQL